MAIKIRFRVKVPEAYEDELDPVQVVDDAVDPLTRDQADFGLDEDIGFALKDEGKVFVYYSLNGYSYEVPEDLVDQVPAAAFEAYDRAHAPMPGFFTDSVLT